MLVKFPILQKGLTDATFLAAGSVPFAKHNIINKTTGLQKGYLTEHTIFFIIQGKKNFHFKDGVVTVNEHELILMKRGIYTISEQLSSNECFEALMLFIPQKMISSLIQNISIIKSNTTDEFAIVPKNKLIKGFEKQYLELFNWKINGLETLLALKLHEIMMLLSNTPQGDDIAGLLHSCINKEAYDIEFIVREHLFQPLSIPDFAKLCSRSITSFKRDFEKLFQLPPKQWINEQRLLYANKLLKSSSDPIVDIAFECGFESASHFIKLYKQHFGVTPNKARAK